MSTPLKTLHGTATDTAAESPEKPPSDAPVDDASVDPETGVEPVEVRFARAYRAAPGAFTHVRCFFLRHERDRRGRMLGPDLPYSAAQDLRLEVARAHGAGWYDVALWNEHNKVWGTQGRIECGPPPVDEPAVMTAARNEAATLHASAAAGNAIAEKLLIRMMDHNVERERHHDEDLRRRSDEAFESAKMMFLRDTVHSTVGEVFEGLTRLTEVVLDARDRKRLRAAPKDPDDDDDDKGDDDDDKARRGLAKVARILLAAARGDWTPDHLVETLRAVYGDDETERLFASMPTVVAGCVELEPQLGDVLTSPSGKKWAAKVVTHFTALAGDDTPAT